MVSEGPSAGGTADGGLGGPQTGGLVVTGPDVTSQLNETGLLKPPLEVRSMVAIADPPGSTAGRFRPSGMLRPKVWPWARGADAADSSDRNNGKMRARTICLGANMIRLDVVRLNMRRLNIICLNMRGWELTTSIPPAAQKLPELVRMSVRMLISRKIKLNGRSLSDAPD